MRARFLSFFGRWASALRAIAGVPDYECYLSHMRARHTGDRIMTETEFNLTRMRERYDRPGSRCC